MHRNSFSILLLFFLCQSYTHGQNEKSLGAKSLEVTSAFEAIHILPVGINDTLSSRIFDQTISSMSSSLMLTQDNYKTLETFRYAIDDQILKSESTYYDSLTSMINRNAIYLSSNLSEIVDIPNILKNDLSFKISKNDTIQYASSLDKLLEKWRKHIIFNSVRKAFNTYPETDPTDNDAINDILTFGLSKQIEDDICKLNNYATNGNTKENQALYLESIALSYDPHSSYFSYDTKANFEEMLSTSEERFGFGMEEKDGLWKISFIKPGSDAWIAGSINVGDVVSSIKSIDNEELISDCASLDDITVKLANSDCKTISITVIKKNKEVITIKMTKKLFASSDNQMSGLILQNEKKIGYISLPSFYTNWDGYQVDGCANDVAKEILKLKKDSIEGLILDLRNNGGGSVIEAIDLAGIFVDMGPLGIVNYAEGKPKLMKDFNRGRVYSGPLMVLVNGASASASEIVAGALQYHKRAVIVGSATYGKATGQVVVPSDTTTWLNYYSGLSTPENYIKVTQSQFYSPDKTTHQKSGINPDIVIPYLWDEYFPSEADEPFALNHPSIVKNVYFEPTLTLPYAELKSKSKNRIDNDPVFAKVNEYKDSLKTSYTNDFELNLNFTSIWDYLKTRDKNINNLFDINTKSSPVFDVNHSKYNNQLNDMDDEFKKMITENKTRLEKDLTLNEVYLIMLDIINLNK